MRDQPATGPTAAARARHRGPELTAAAALVAAVALVVAFHFPDAGALETLACIKFYLAQGCLP